MYQYRYLLKLFKKEEDYIDDSNHAICFNAKKEDRGRFKLVFYDPANYLTNDIVIINTDFEDRINFCPVSFQIGDHCSFLSMYYMLTSRDHDVFDIRSFTKEQRDFFLQNMLPKWAGLYDKTGLETSHKQTFKISSYPFNRDENYLDLVDTVLSVLKKSRCVYSDNLQYYAILCQAGIRLQKMERLKSKKDEILKEFNSGRKQLRGTNKPKIIPLRVILLRKQIRDLNNEMCEVRQDRQPHIKKGQLTIDKAHLGYQDKFLKRNQIMRKQTTYLNEARI